MFGNLLTLGLCAGLITWMLFAGVRGLDKRQGPRLDAKTELSTVAKLCTPEPTVVDGQRIRHFRGTLVPHPFDETGLFGTTSNPKGGISGGRWVQLDDGSLLVMTTGLDKLVIHYMDEDETDADRETDFPLAGMTVGDRVSFCATLGADTYWWPQTGYDGSGLFDGPIYGKPVGPYPTARWIMDLNPHLP